MTTSFVAANAIFQLIIGNRCKENEIYRATRMAPIKNNKEVGNMLKETTNSLILNKLKEPILSLEELKIGEGGIVSYNGKKIGAYKKSENEIKPIIVGFCAENENLIENAREKIARKGCDYLVANDISRKDIGFGSDENEVTILNKNGEIKKLEKASKNVIAREILEWISTK